MSETALLVAFVAGCAAASAAAFAAGWVAGNHPSLGVARRVVGWFADGVEREPWPASRSAPRLPSGTPEWSLVDEAEALESFRAARAVSRFTYPVVLDPPDLADDPDRAYWVQARRAWLAAVRDLEREDEWWPDPRPTRFRYVIDHYSGGGP